MYSSLKTSDVQYPTDIIKEIWDKVQHHLPGASIYSYGYKDSDGYARIGVDNAWGISVCPPGTSVSYKEKGSDAAHDRTLNKGSLQESHYLSAQRFATN